MLMRSHFRPTIEVKYLTIAFVIFLYLSTIMQGEYIQIIYCEEQLIFFLTYIFQKYSKVLSFEKSVNQETNVVSNK